MPNILLMFVGVCALALVLPPILDFLETKLVYKDDGYGVARRKVVDAEIAMGGSYSDAQEALFLREMMARVRREASDAVRTDPSLWLEHIENAKRGAAAEIAAYKPHLVSRFLNSVGGLSYGHILYPAEAKMIDRYSLYPLPAVTPTEDQRAALRIVGN